jgi:hypothetical protein
MVIGDVSMQADPDGDGEILVVWVRPVHQEYHR